MNELLGGADSRPRLHIWPDTDGWRFSYGPNGKRFEGSKDLYEAVGMAVYSFEDRLADGAVILIEKAATRTFAEEIR